MCMSVHCSVTVATIYVKSELYSPCYGVLLLASERSERDTIRGVQIRAGAVRIYIYICMEVRMSY